MKIDEQHFNFTGKALQSAVRFERPSLDFKFEDGHVTVREGDSSILENIAPYLPGGDVREVVKLAQILHRPILLRGEPGCGKTRLAEAVAFERYGKDFRKYYFEWYIKSTSKAIDGLYSFDHLRRLRDSNLRDQVQDDTNYNIRRYRDLGQVGKAMALSTKVNPTMLLIDEIDKADIDFPNDLLLELDEKRFFIEETREEIRAGYPPIIFITSNNEKELPPAFLRRCLYLYITFPDSELLMNIIKAKYNDQDFLSQTGFLNTVVEKFSDLRKEIKNDPSMSKQVSTSELLDWVGVLYFYFKNHPDEYQKEYEKINSTDLPFASTLKKGYQEFMD